MRQLSYYTMRQIFIKKCASFYKMRRLLQMRRYPICFCFSLWKNSNPPDQRQVSKYHDKFYRKISLHL